MTQRSPTEMIFREPGPDDEPLGMTTLLWERRDTFGPYMRRLRELTGLSLRKASADLGLSYTYLCKLETGAKATPPSIGLMQRMASVYGRDLREVMHEAGFRFETPPEVDQLLDTLDERFRRLVMAPTLRPLRMDDRVIELIPPLVKRQWIDFAQSLEARVLASGAIVNRLLKDGDVSAKEDDE